MSFYGISTFGKVSKVIKVIKMSVISVIFTGFLRSACPNKLFWTFWIFWTYGVLTFNLGAG